MTQSLDPDETRDLITAAKRGDQKAIGMLLAAFRADLKAIADAETDSALNARFDASDIVQQTCLSAIQRIGDFHGSEQAQFRAWIKQIHHRNIQDAVRRNKQAGKRAISKEQTARESGLGKPEAIGAEGDTPSQHVIRRESLDQLQEALQRLPEDQREVVRLRCFEEWEFQRICDHLGRSRDSVASLLKRGLRNLRKFYNSAEY